MRKVFFIVLINVFCINAFSKTVKVACVGNSITYGMTIENREEFSYPSQLQKMLGGDFEVGNFGKSGATLLYKGHRPYVDQEEFRKAMDFAGDIVVIHLGTNDTDPRNWPNYRDEFIGDYRALMDSFKLVNPKCKFILARLSPISHRNVRFESGTRDWLAQIQETVETIAKTTGAQLIDFHAPLYPYPNFIPDGLHPNAQGARILAKTVYKAITGDFGGLQMPEVYSDNMVLQRNTNLVIRGFADAGEKVTVSIDKQKVSAVTSSSGEWQVELKPLPVGENYELNVSTKKRSLVYKNVAVGEVWLCSGQSNMEFHLGSCATAAKDVPLANNSSIRLFDMKENWRTDAVEWSASALDSLKYLLHYAPSKWEVCSPNVASGFSAVAYYFGKMLQDSLQVPIGLICNAVGGSPTEAWVDRRTLEHDFPSILRNWTENDFVQPWVRERAKLNIKNSTDKLQRHPYEPCYLFETGILPLKGFPIKGAIWYQGESNAHNIEAHEKLFGLLVKSWRKFWNNEEMPFYFVQLSSINRPSWPWFRDSQRCLMNEISNTAMAVSSDKGDFWDVHPTQKKEIGERLSLWALSKTYGYKKVIPSGPLFKEVVFKKTSALVSFTYAKGLRSSDGEPLRTFEIAGEDEVFYPADAEIKGDKVKVWSKNVKNPKFVRYAWQPFTDANLVNAADLPASTFRSK
ncbi:MAG: sialate O-acetylesterase [Paludibacteraceae bacterium]|nr:sialate O-acetylesterase [Paludibacteraceae bacterium]